MKHKILEWVAFILFIGSIGSIMGTAGSLELGYITMGQAIIRSGIGLLVLAVDVPVINYLQREDEAYGNYPGR